MGPVGGAVSLVPVFWVYQRTGECVVLSNAHMMFLICGHHLQESPGYRNVLHSLNMYLFKNICNQLQFLTIQMNLYTY